MTYQEIKDRLSKCEYTLNKLKDSTSKGKDTKTIAKLEILKESLQKKLNEAEDGVIFTDDERKAKELAKDGARVKLTKEEEEVEKLSKKEVSLIAKEAGKAVVQVIQLMLITVLSKQPLTQLQVNLFKEIVTQMPVQEFGTLQAHLILTVTHQ